MKRLLPYALLLGTAPLATSCQTAADIRPANYDALALATGHWEWESSAYQQGLKTPASLGFTRQLLFGEGGRLTVRRAGQADYHTTYQLAMGPLTACGPPSPNVPLVTFTSESDLPNNDTKTYQLSQQSTMQVLLLTGEAACVDGGAYEVYQWIAE